MVQTGFSTWHAAGPRRLSRAGRAPTRMPGVLGSRRSRSGRSAGRSARQTGLAAGKQWARMRMRTAHRNPGVGPTPLRAVRL